MLEIVYSFMLLSLRKTRSASEIRFKDNKWMKTLFAIAVLVELNDLIVGSRTPDTEL